MKKAKKRVRPERLIEKSACDDLSDNWVSWKMNGLGHSSRPDRLFLGKGVRSSHGKHFFIEFKKPGEEPTPLQWEEIHELHDNGHDVGVCASEADALRFAEEVLKSHRRAILWVYWEHRQKGVDRS